MNIIGQIKSGSLEEIDLDDLNELVDSHEKLLRSAKRVNRVMSGHMAYTNVAFTLRSAIEKAERLYGGPVEEEGDDDAPLSSA